MGSCMNTIFYATVHVRDFWIVVCFSHYFEVAEFGKGDVTDFNAPIRIKT